ncbi:MAG: carbohydrate ABC transporter permease [Phycisphaerae bacterium]
MTDHRPELKEDIPSVPPTPATPPTTGPAVPPPQDASGKPGTTGPVTARAGGGWQVVKTIIIYTLLAGTAFLMLMPLIWLVLSAFRANDVFFEYVFWIPPDSATLDNFRELYTEVSVAFHRMGVNSMFVAGMTTLVQLFFASLGGFALAKYDFAGKKPIMIMMLMTMMIPPQVMLAPLYELLTQMRLTDTYVGLIVPGAVSVFGMFLFRQSMMNIPDDLLQAGRMDGCSEFGLYWNVALPVSRPMIGAFCLIAFMATWNSFLWPQIILNTAERFTLPIGLTQLVGLQQQRYGALMAGTLLSILPVAVLFFVLQKEFIRGLTAGAVKG